MATAATFLRCSRLTSQYAPRVPDADARARTGTVVAAFLALASGTLSLAGFELILVSVQTDLGFSVDNATALILMPSAASLLVVFVAGSLTDRWSPRRILVIATALFLVGTAILGVAPSLEWVIVARILDGVGGVTMSIVALAVLNTSVTDPARRSRVFGIYAALTPAVFLISPCLSAVIVEFANWRLGVIPWLALGLVSLVASLRFIPQGSSGAGAEIATPLLAGVVLAGLALGMLNFANDVTLALALWGTALVSIVVLVVLMRRMTSPALRLGWCREPRALIMLGVVAIASMPSMYFYMKLLLQYRYTISLVTLALLLIVPQACAIAGGLLSGPISARIRPPRAAMGALFVAALACLATLLVSGQSPVWVPLIVLAISAAPIAFIIGPITNTLMSQAPADVSGAASSVRKATWTLGGVVGGAIIGAASFHAFQNRLTDLLTTQGMAVGDAAAIADAIRGGAVVDELVSVTTSPIASAALAAKGPALLEAQSYALHVMGVISAVMYVAAALLMLVLIRRTRRDQVASFS